MTNTIDPAHMYAVFMNVFDPFCTTALMGKWIAGNSERDYSIYTYRRQLKNVFFAVCLMPNSFAIEILISLFLML